MPEIGVERLRIIDSNARQVCGEGIYKLAEGAADAVDAQRVTLPSSQARRELGELDDGDRMAPRPGQHKGHRTSQHGNT